MPRQSISRILYLTCGSSQSTVQGVEPPGNGRVSVETALVESCEEYVLSNKENVNTRIKLSVSILH